MPKYVRKPVTVDAFSWQRQPREGWPEWVQVYRGLDSLGQHSQIGTSAVGLLLVPIKGTVHQLNIGDYIVLDGYVDKLADGTPIVRGTVSVMGGAEFSAAHDEIDE